MSWDWREQRLRQLRSKVQRLLWQRATRSYGGRCDNLAIAEFPPIDFYPQRERLVGSVDISFELVEVAVLREVAGELGDRAVDLCRGDCQAIRGCVDVKRS